MARITVLKGEAEGSIIEISEKDFKIGRDPSNDLIIKEPFVSRRHATIRYKRGKYLIIDSSINGTRIKDRPVKKKYLEDGDEIEIGGTVLKFELALQEKTPEAKEVMNESKNRLLKTGTLAAGISLIAILVISIFYFISTPSKPGIFSSQPGTGEKLPLQEKYLSDPVYHFKMGNRLYREKRIKEQNLYLSILYWKRGLELLRNTDSETYIQIEKFVDRISKELEGELKTEMFGAYQAYHLGNIKECRMHLEKILRMMPDVNNPFHKSALEKLKALK